MYHTMYYLTSHHIIYNIASYISSYDIIYHIMRQIKQIIAFSMTRTENQITNQISYILFIMYIIHIYVNHIASHHVN